MKYINTIVKCSILALATLSTSCSTELDTLLSDSGKQKLVTLTADIANNSSASASRSTYSDTGSFTWGTDEKIAVFSVNTFSEFSMTSVDDTKKSATFSGTVAESVTSTYALYPYRSDYSQTVGKKGVTTINSVLPDIYSDYVPGTTQSNLPM